MEFLIFGLQIQTLKKFCLLGSFLQAIWSFKFLGEQIKVK